MNITKLRKLWFSFSALLVLGSLLLVGIFGLNFGLDFTGGARWELAFTEQTTTEQLKTFFNKRSELSQSVQIQSSEDNTFLITIQDLEDKVIQTIAGSLKTEVGSFEEKSYRKVDSNIGASFKRMAFYSIVIALFGMIIYVAFAFRKIQKLLIHGDSVV